MFLENRLLSKENNNLEEYNHEKRNIQKYWLNGFRIKTYDYLKKTKYYKA